MSLSEHPVICDGCGKDRRLDSNKWFIMWEFFIIDGGNAKGMVLIPFTLEEAVKPGKAHACGVNCAQKLSERFLTFGSLFFRPSDATAVKH